MADDDWDEIKKGLYIIFVSFLFGVFVGSAIVVILIETGAQ